MVSDLPPSTTMTSETENLTGDSPSLNTSSAAHTSSPLTPTSPGILIDLGPPHGTFNIYVTNISHSVSIKLDRTNYPLWHAQFLPVLHGQRLMGFVDGSIPSPPPHVSPSSSTSPPLEPSNPSYLAWFRIDQTVQSWIMATLTPAALGEILGLHTSVAMWSQLQHQFASSLQARLLQLKFELQHVKKGSLSMADYLDKVKTISDHLSAAGRPVDHDDLVFYTLGGLGAEFEPLAMTVTSRLTPITIDELHTMLLTQEHRLSIASQMASLDLSASSPSANVASRSPSHSPSDNRSRGRGRGQGRGRGRGRNNTNSYYNNGGRSTSSSGHPSASNLDSRPLCQLCSKRGHTVISCYHRFDQTFQPSAPPTANTAQTTDPTCDSLWYPDSGA